MAEDKRPDGRSTLIADLPVKSYDARRHVIPIVADSEATLVCIILDTDGWPEGLCAIVKISWPDGVAVSGFCYGGQKYASYRLSAAKVKGITQGLIEVEAMKTLNTSIKIAAVEDEADVKMIVS